MASIQDWTEAPAALFREHSSCLSWPTQYLAVYSTDSSFTLNPFLLAGQLNTNVKVNNMATPHHMYTDMHIYITFILVFTLFFILLPFPWAGWRAQTLPFRHSWSASSPVQLYTYTRLVLDSNLCLSEDCPWLIPLSYEALIKLGILRCVGLQSPVGWGRTGDWEDQRLEFVN